MLSYSAIKQGNKLVNIVKITTQMTATTTAGEFNLNAPGEWFYFTDGADKALYETVRQSANGTIVKRNDDTVVINAFSQAITLGQTEAVIILSDVQNEAQEAVKEIVHETIINQPIVQPVIVQSNEQIVVFAENAADPKFEEVATYAETWTWQNIAQPIIAKGVKVYNDNIPNNEVRPREYVVMTVDDELQDVDFADNKNNSEESFITLIIQGRGNTFENWVVEISKYIHEILRGFRENGKVHTITNRNIGFDETTKILSRTISFWLIN